MCFFGFLGSNAIWFVFHCSLCGCRKGGEDINRHIFLLNRYNFDWFDRRNQTLWFWSLWFLLRRGSFRGKEESLCLDYFEGWLLIWFDGVVRDDVDRRRTMEVVLGCRSGSESIWWGTAHLKRRIYNKNQKQNIWNTFMKWFFFDNLLSLFFFIFSSTMIIILISQ